MAGSGCLTLLIVAFHQHMAQTFAIGSDYGARPARDGQMPIQDTGPIPAIGAHGLGHLAVIGPREMRMMW